MPGRRARRALRGVSAQAARSVPAHASKKCGFIAKPSPATSQHEIGAGAQGTSGAAWAATQEWQNEQRGEVLPLTEVGADHREQQEHERRHHQHQGDRAPENAPQQHGRSESRDDGRGEHRNLKVAGSARCSARAIHTTTAVRNRMRGGLVSITST